MRDLILMAAIGLSAGNAPAQSLGEDSGVEVPSTAVDREGIISRHFQVHNGLSDYWQFLKLSRGVSPNLRVSNFRKFVIQPNIEAYSSVALRWLSDENSLEQFERALHSQTVRFRKVDSELIARMNLAWEKFQAYVPDLESGVPVYVLAAPRMAIGGSVRPLKKQSALVLGAEELSTVIDSQTAFNVLLNHEMTHLYHLQVNAEMRQMVSAVYMPPYDPGHSRIYQILFLEGLAAYTSRNLNPTATDSEVLLSDTVAAEVKSLWPGIGEEIRKHLNSSDKDDINKYLFDGQVSESFPRRAGYYVGMLIAAELSKRSSFAGLCRLSGAELQIEVESALLNLEKSGL